MRGNQRKSELAQFGESVVFEALEKNGYQCTRLGDYFRCFDIEASKGTQKLLVSVKTRNHTTDKNDEKRDCYNLFYKKKAGDDADSQVKVAEEIARLRSALPMWAAVRVDVLRRVYDIYFGGVHELKNKKQIPMGPNDRRRHKKLAESVFDQRIVGAWSNVRRRPAAQETRLVRPEA